MNIRNPNTQNRNTTRITVLVQPRFSLLQILVAALLLAAVVIGGRMLSRRPAPQPIPQTASITTLDPSLADTSAIGWIINPLRAACAEWESDDGRYAWLTGPLKERGLTTADVLDFCERLGIAPSHNPAPTSAP